MEIEMKPTPCSVPEDAYQVMPDADFADAFTVEISGQHHAKAAACAALGTAPLWVEKLMALRNALVVPLGLKPDGGTVPKIGPFPILHEDANRVVLGLNDRHLDFRIVFDTEATANNQTKATLTTILKRHNLWGRAYLAVVLPFHKLIVPTMLKRTRSLS
jgi:Protein of unknown function (DUF2867)